jgi:hypothetical protein
MNRLDTTQPPGGGNADPGLPGPWTAEAELEQLKQRLLRQELAHAAPHIWVALRRAANEAAALAWLEQHPLLVFPTLFAELILAARRHAHKQEFVRARSAELLMEAA